MNIDRISIALINLKQALEEEDRWTDGELLVLGVNNDLYTCFQEQQQERPYDIATINKDIVLCGIAIQNAESENE